ncbi:MAG: Zn-ribbon domain-containing OB-fold protein [Thaumarchaeota archaeon]|nr:Zn-ribbon domain-containing OB-fold protein [Candidatus Calditenuaceae archaeon]MDW8187295.1 Zn-ribbon domain-containing OB-fold protein [Nitrososphaerota archaeon]
MSTRITKEQIEAFVKGWLSYVEAEKGRSGLPIVSDEKTGDPLFVDQRELRLRYLIPVKRISQFFEGLKRNEVLYTECKTCNAKYFPPQSDCSRCGSGDIEWKKVEGEGTLLTYTKIFVKPTSFMHYDDYIIGIARMKEGFNVLAWVRAGDVSELKIGMPVKLEVERRQLDSYLTYVLVPARS